MGVTTVATEEVVLSINQQQLELLDNTVEQGHAVDRVALIRRALREFAAWHPAEPSQSQKD
jgi:metal-responsive CopG/Arc/MetJ family transcriptional regulator